MKIAWKCHLILKVNHSSWSSWNEEFFEIFFLWLLHLLLFITTKYAIICVKRRPIVRKYEHLRKYQIQLRFLHFNQHSITLWGIHMGQWSYTFINANIKVINTILKVNMKTWHALKCKHHSLTFLWHCLQFNSIPWQP